MTITRRLSLSCRKGSMKSQYRKYIYRCDLVYERNRDRMFLIFVTSAGVNSLGIMPVTVARCNSAAGTLPIK